MIEVKDLSKKYGSHLAVDHLSFHVEKGQIYGFLGVNGAGKSTTMNMLTGYLAATEGTIIINGHNIQEEPEKAKKCIGYLPELPPVYTDMTVLEYLRFVAELKQLPKEERANQIAEVMELTKITDMAPRLIKNLSKGYKQRVGLAQALLGFPEVIILDEPTVGLDPKQIIEIRDLIKSLGKEHTILLSSHILSEVSAVCDQIMIISHGKLVASDTPDGLKKMMQKGCGLSLTVKGDTENVSSVLSLFDNVKDTVITDSKETGCVDVTLTMTEDTDVRESLFFALAEKKMPILAMQKTEQSLEDIFLILTGEDTGTTDLSMSSDKEAATDTDTATETEGGNA